MRTFFAYYVLRKHTSCCVGHVVGHVSASNIMDASLQSLLEGKIVSLCSIQSLESSQKIDITRTLKVKNRLRPSLELSSFPARFVRCTIILPP